MSASPEEPLQHGDGENEEMEEDTAVIVCPQSSAIAVVGSDKIKATQK